MSELFTIVFEDGTVSIIEFPKLLFEAEIFPNDNEIYIFFTERYIYRLRIYISPWKITGDIRVRTGDQNWSLCAFLKSDDKLDTNSLSMNSISTCQQYWDETIPPRPILKKDESNLFTFLQKCGMESYYEKFVEQEVDMEALLLFNEQTLEKYIEKDGPRLKFWNQLKKLQEE